MLSSPSSASLALIDYSLVDRGVGGVLGGWAFSYERVTPVSMKNSLWGVGEGPRLEIEYRGFSNLRYDV